MSAPKRKHQQILIETKKDYRCIGNEDYSDLVKDSKLTKSTLFTIVKNKQKILGEIDDGVGAKREKLFAY
jgi:hypothetical protein